MAPARKESTALPSLTYGAPGRCSPPDLDGPFSTPPTWVGSPSEPWSEAFLKASRAACAHRKRRTILEVGAPHGDSRVGRCSSARRILDQHHAALALALDGRPRLRGPGEARANGSPGRDAGGGQGS